MPTLLFQFIFYTINHPVLKLFWSVEYFYNNPNAFLLETYTGQSFRIPKPAGDFGNLKLIFNILRNLIIHINI